MNNQENRLLDPSLLPDTLWNAATKTLLLPPRLTEIYQTLIARHGLEELAHSRDRKNPPVGGEDQKATNKHFAQAFDGSVARAQLAVIDPLRKVDRASNALIQSFSGDRLCLTDAPCGAGAATFAFLATFAELRARNVLPRYPLRIDLIGAEISEEARRYAQEIFMDLAPWLEKQAIFVTSNFLPWDVTNSLSTTDLIKKMTLASAENQKRLLVIANVNGFLEREGKRKEAKPQLEEVFRHASGKNSVAIWIEPQMNRSTGPNGLFQQVKTWVNEKWRKFSRINTEGDSDQPVLTADCRFRSPLKPTNNLIVRLAVMRLDLERST